MLTGVFLCLKYEIPAILKQGSGAIVNTSSGAGLIGFPTMANYVAAKHGVIGLTKTAALENATTGLRINAVCPGTARSKMVDEWIDGDPAKEAEVVAMHPIGRIAESEEIAAAVLWLCSDSASFMIGHSLVIDGGYSIQ
jgi:NAD(P)-dependent dehydrogenase (short-subunit alcohol dehydrogenase family)